LLIITLTRFCLFLYLLNSTCCVIINTIVVKITLLQIHPSVNSNPIGQRSRIKFGMTESETEIPRRPRGLARNDKRRLDSRFHGNDNYLDDNIILPFSTPISTTCPSATSPVISANANLSNNSV